MEIKPEIQIPEMIQMVSHIDSEYYDRPLPDRTKIDIWECYARHVLLFIDSDKYGSLVYSDKPDLIDKAQSLGVEVTDSRPQNSREAESLYSKLAYTKDPSWKKRQIERIEKCGAHYENGILFGPKGTDSFEQILKAHLKKLKRLNSGDYAIFKRNELFMTSTILADEEMIREALSHMKEQSCIFPRRFDSVIVTVPGRNYVFSLNASTCESLKFEYCDQYRIANDARQEVIRADLI